MDTTIYRAALYSEGLLALYLLVNGVGHNIGVWMRHRAGTLSHGLSLPPMLWLGAGLFLAGVFAAIGFFTIRASSTLVPAFIATALLAAVIALTARAYGFTFLGGSITLGTLNLGLVLLYALKR